MLNETAVADKKGVGKVGALTPSRSPPRPEKDEGDVGVWEPKERRTEQFNTRITKSLKKGLEVASAVLAHVQQTLDGDDKAEVPVADLVERFLSSGLEGLWEELEIPEPRTPEEIEAAKRRAVEFYLRLGKDAKRKRGQ